MRREFILEITKNGNKESIITNEVEQIVAKIDSINQDEQSTYLVKFIDEEKKINKVIMENEQMTFNKILLMFRLARGLSRSYMEKELELTYNGYQQIENSRNDIKLSTLLRIKDILGFSLQIFDYLPFIEEEKNKKKRGN